MSALQPTSLDFSRPSRPFPRSSMVPHSLDHLIRCLAGKIVIPSVELRAVNKDTTPHTFIRNFPETHTFPDRLACDAKNSSRFLRRICSALTHYLSLTGNRANDPTGTPHVLANLAVGSSFRLAIAINVYAVTAPARADVFPAQNLSFITCFSALRPSRIAVRSTLAPPYIVATTSSHNRVFLYTYTHLRISTSLRHQPHRDAGSREGWRKPPSSRTQRSPLLVPLTPDPRSAFLLTQTTPVPARCTRQYPQRQSCPR